MENLRCTASSMRQSSP